jgi:hypothetical protein
LKRQYDMGLPGWQTNPNCLAAKWDNFMEYSSELSHFLISIGTTTDPQSVLNWQHVELAKSFELNDFTLEDNLLYKVSIMAVNTAGLEIVTTSSGVLVDTSPPIVGYVLDHNASNPAFVASNVYAFWGNWSDPESDTFQFEYAFF